MVLTPGKLNLFVRMPDIDSKVVPFSKEFSEPTYLLLSKSPSSKNLVTSREIAEISSPVKKS